MLEQEKISALSANMICSRPSSAGSSGANSTLGVAWAAAHK